MLVCTECGYKRSRDQDGKIFVEAGNGDHICWDCVPLLAGPFAPEIDEFLDDPKLGVRRLRSRPY